MKKENIDRDRTARFEQSPQLTLGELIYKLEEVLKECETPEDTAVYYDFGYFMPTKTMSWRGSYSEMALGYTEEGGSPTITKVIGILKESIGKKFSGYKGGDFTMTIATPVWCANYGHSGHTAITNVSREGYKVILHTGYDEY